MGLRETLSNLVSQDNSRLCTQFAVGIGIAVLSFMGVSAGFTAYLIKLLLHPTVMVGTPPSPVLADIPPNLKSLLDSFLMAAVAGAGITVVHGFGRPWDRGGEPPPGPPGG